MGFYSGMLDGFFMPKLEVLYHLKPYLFGTSPCIPYIDLAYGRCLQFRKYRVLGLYLLGSCRFVTKRGKYTQCTAVRICNIMGRPWNFRVPDVETISMFHSIFLYIYIYIISFWNASGWWIAVHVLIGHELTMLVPERFSYLVLFSAHDELACLRVICRILAP